MFSLPMAAALVCCLFLGGMAALWRQIPWALTQRGFSAEPNARRWQLGLGLAMAVLFPCLGTLMGGDDSARFVQNTVFISILAVTLSLAWLAQHQSFRSGLFAVLLFCLAIPGVVLPTVVMLPQSLQLSPVFALNIGFAGIGAGALFAPHLFKLVWRRFNFRHGFLLLALGCLLPALLVAVTDHENFSLPQPPPPAAAKKDPQDQKPAAKDAKRSPTAAVADSPPGEVHWWVLMLAAFVVPPLLSLLPIWHDGFLAQNDTVHRVTRPGFWIAYFGIGLVIGWIIPDDYAAWALVCLAGAHAMILGHLAGDFGHRGSTFGFWLAGGTLAPMLPTLLAVPLLYYMTINETAMLGWVLGVMALSHFLWSLLAEPFVEKWSAPGVLNLALLLTLAFAALALTLALVHSELYGNPVRPPRRHHHWHWPWRPVKKAD